MRNWRGGVDLHSQQKVRADVSGSVFDLQLEVVNAVRERCAHRVILCLRDGDGKLTEICETAQIAERVIHQNFAVSVARSPVESILHIIWRWVSIAGNGVIPLTSAQSGAETYVCELSGNLAQVLEGNASANGVGDRVHCEVGGVLENAFAEEKFDVIFGFQNRAGFVKRHEQSSQFEKVIAQDIGLVVLRDIFDGLDILKQLDRKGLFSGIVQNKS